MVEVREVLRLWLKGHGYRRIAELVQADRKTVRRYVEAARDAGLERGGGDEVLTDELLGVMAEQLPSGRPRHLYGEGLSCADPPAHRTALAPARPRSEALAGRQSASRRSLLQLVGPVVHGARRHPKCDHLLQLPLEQAIRRIGPNAIEFDTDPGAPAVAILAARRRVHAEAPDGSPGRATVTAEGDYLRTH